MPGKESLPLYATQTVRNQRIPKRDPLQRSGEAEQHGASEAGRAVLRHLPLWNSRGQAQAGAFADGGVNKCEMVGGYERCVKHVWPQGWFALARPRLADVAWHGTLPEDKRDATGTHYRRNRYYDPGSGRFTQEDPIGLAGGLNLWGFAEGDPVSYSDPYGLCARGRNDTIPKVEVCSAVADIPLNFLNLEHRWLRTGSVEAGLGQAGGGVPGEGEYRLEDNSPYVTDTEITDHRGRGAAPGATCRPVAADAQCINSQLNIGQSRGKWSPVNQCQTFVRQVLATCSSIPTTVQRDASNIAPPPLRP